MYSDKLLQSIMWLQRNHPLRVLIETAETFLNWMTFENLYLKAILILPLSPTDKISYIFLWDRESLDVYFNIIRCHIEKYVINFCIFF